MGSPSYASTARPTSTPSTRSWCVELTQAARSFHDDLDTHAVVLAGAPNALLRRLRSQGDGWLDQRDRRPEAAAARLWRRAPVQGLGSDAAGHDRRHGAAGGRRRRRHRAGLRLARAGQGRVPLRAGSEDRPQPAVGRAAAADQPGRAGAGQAHLHPVREDAGGAGAGLGAGRGTGRGRQDGRPGARAGRGGAVDAGADGAHGEGSGERHRWRAARRDRLRRRRPEPAHRDVSPGQVGARYVSESRRSGRCARNGHPTTRERTVGQEIRSRPPTAGRSRLSGVAVDARRRPA